MKDKLDYIDTMRGIAILMVIMVHTSHRVEGLPAWAEFSAKYGQLGVQLFFVASAYTLCLSSNRRSSEGLPLAGFYIRRYFRIAPLYYVGIALYFLLNVIRHWQSNGNFDVGQYTIFNVFCNIIFAHGFVPEANNNIVPGGWSIGVEMAFYLVFPFLLFLLRRFGGVFLFGLSCLVLLVNVISSVIYVPVANGSFEYYSFFNQLPVFLLGMAYFSYAQKKPAGFGLWLTVLGFLVFFALSLAVWRAKYSFSFVLLPYVAAVSFVLLMDFFKVHIGGVRVLSKIGRVSFSMYIFHFLFAWVLVGGVLRRAPDFFRPEVNLLLSFFALVFVSYVVARITEPLIEERGIRFGGGLVRKIQSKK